MMPPVPYAGHNRKRAAAKRAAPNTLLDAIRSNAADIGPDRVTEFAPLASPAVKRGPTPPGRKRRRIELRTTSDEMMAAVKGEPTQVGNELRSPITLARLAEGFSREELQERLPDILEAAGVHVTGFSAKKRSSPKKPTFLLADSFRFNEPQMAHPSVVANLRKLLLTCNRFVLDDEAARKLGHFVRYNSDLVADHQQFALPPYETMWIEFPLLPLLEAADIPVTERGDQTLGYLIHDGTVYTVVSGTRTEGHVLLFSYHLHTPFPFEEQVRIAEFLQTDRLMLSSCMWGSATEWGIGIDNSERLHSLRDNHRLGLVRPVSMLYSGAQWPPPPGVTVGKRLAGLYTHMIYDGIAGDLRNIIAILLLLNQPTVMQVVSNEPAGRHFHSGKLRPYFSHTKITLHLDPPIVRRSLEHHATGDVRPRHGVKGHFAHTDGRKGCEHNWVRYDWITNTFDTELDHWVCAHCMRKRWWRRDHERGSALIGYNSHTYQITE